MKGSTHIVAAGGLGGASLLYKLRALNISEDFSVAFGPMHFCP